MACVDLTVPRATEGGKFAKEGKAMEDKGKGKAEEGQDTYGEGGSSGRGGSRLVSSILYIFIFSW